MRERGRGRNFIILNNLYRKLLIIYIENYKITKRKYRHTGYIRDSAYITIIIKTIFNFQN